MQITYTVPASIPTSIPTAATRHIARAALLILAVTAPALSQTSGPPAGPVVPASFEQLRVLVGPGAKVTVINATGGQTTGTISALTASSLSLGVDGRLRDFGEADVATIRQRRADSLANGAKWGFGIGAGVGLLGGLAIGAEYGGEDALLLGGIGAGVYGAIGAAIGVGVDAMFPGNQVIYSNAAGSAARVTVRPALTRGRLGVLASLAF